METDIKADLRRLAELRQDIRDLIGEGHTEALADFRSACIRFNFSAVLQRLEELESRCEHSALQAKEAIRRSISGSEGDTRFLSVEEMLAAWTRDEADEQAKRIAELEAALRLCAVFSGKATGDEETDNASMDESASVELLDVPDLVNDRIAELDCEVARQSESLSNLLRQLDEVQGENRRLREQLPPDVLLRKVIIREEID